MSVSLTYDSVLSRVRIAADWPPITDTFTRTTSNGWGTSDSGHPWALSGGSASDYSTNGTAGLISAGSVNVERRMLVNSGWADQQIRLWCTVPVTPTGAAINWGALLRWQDSSNHYWVDVQVGTDSSLTLRVLKRVAGVLTQVASVASGVTHSTSVPRVLKTQIIGSTIRARLWASDAGEPATWQLTYVDPTPDLAIGTQVGAISRLMTGNTNTLPVVFTFDNVRVDQPTPIVVQRSKNQLAWTTVRGGSDLAAAADAISLDDYEFTSDVSNYYRVPNAFYTPLNANPYFETNAANWTGLGGASVARSTVQFHQGVASLLLTPDGVTLDPRTESERVPVVSGVRYRASAWVRCAVARSIDINIAWFTGGGVFVSITATSVPVAANTWTLLSAVYKPPATAAQASAQVRLAGVAPGGDTAYIDEAMLTSEVASITPALTTVWLKSLARPFLNRPVTVTDWSDVERSSRAGVFPVVGRSFPVAVTDLHGSRRWTLDVEAETEQEADDLDLLISTGEVQFVHTPTINCRVPGGYVALGDTSERRLRPRATRRIFSLPLTEVAAPGPDVIPAVGTCQSVLNTYATCGDVLAAHPTCADLLQLVGSAADVIVP